MPPIPEYERLDERALDVGAVLFSLIVDWPAWVHRRVETIEIRDEQTVRRRVSIDLELPAGVPYIDTAPGDPNQPVYSLPLTRVRKRALQHFDLVDDARRSLPLMTASQASRQATGALVAMAQAYAHGKGLDPMPEPVEKDLWSIAHLASEEAHAVWQGIGQGGGVLERAWRRSIASNEELMALAYDLSHSRLLLARMAIRPGERRIVTFAYDEPVLRPARAAHRAARGLIRQANAASRIEDKRREAASQQGMGLVEIVATTRMATAPHRELPQVNLEVIVLWSHRGATTHETVRTDRAGRAVVPVPVGTCTIIQKPPHGLLAESPLSQDVDVRQGRPESVGLVNRRIASATPEEEQRGAKRSTRVLRALGVRPHKVALLVPAIGCASSYHVEALAPEGLQISGCRLEYRRSYPALEQEPTDTSIHEYKDEVKEELRSVPRAHLHVASAYQGASGLLTLRLLPRPTTVAQSAFLTSAVTALLLTVVSWRTQAIGPNTGAVAALVAFASGPLSAYVARPREHRMTSVLIRGTRILALVSGCAGLAAAAAIVLQREWTATSMALAPGPVWAPLWIALGVFALVAMVCAALSLWAWHSAAQSERIVHEPGAPAKTQDLPSIR